ncbi:MAG: ABATE domain-containing protein [Armatimonadetes bacterium]|nr:ABATE domain-containing protein [Armatimonadota bacterium]
MNSRFLFVANHPTLDFLNTEMANGTGARIETLNKPSDVATWFAVVGFDDVATTAQTLADALALRDAVHDLVVAWTNGSDAPAQPLAALNAVLATGAARPQLTMGFARQAEAIGDAPHPLLPIALSALDLLTRHDKTLVRQCGGTGCVLWFLDTTKNKRRRWCAMEACGNREKAATHYKRVKELAKGDAE